MKGRQVLNSQSTGYKSTNDPEVQIEYWVVFDFLFAKMWVW